MSTTYKMGYIEAPNNPYHPDAQYDPTDAMGSSTPPYIFLGGGISNCPNWQKEVHEKLSMRLANGTVLNPRREVFEDLGIDNERKQVEWEHGWLWRADIVVFWFCKETVCPITLHELGAQLGRLKVARRSSISLSQHGMHLECGFKVPRIVVGIEPGYIRKDNVELQIEIACPGQVPVVRSIDQLVGTIHEEINEFVRKNRKGW